MTTRSQSRRARSHQFFPPVALFALLCLAAGAVGQPEAPPLATSLSVVVSIQPWADLVAQIGGERVAVTVLLPSGASPHAFEPSPSQAVGLAKADLVVMNGGLDAWLERLVAATAPGVRTVQLLSAVEFDPLQAIELGAEAQVTEERGDDVHKHAVAANPHIWLDPTIAARAVRLLAGELASLDPNGREFYEHNFAALAAELQRLDSDIAATLDGLADVPFVPFHDAWPYFARRYQLQLTTTLEPFAGREPSARYIADTVLAIRDSGAAVIFSERQLNDRTARVVAESAGVGVVMLDPIGGAPGPTRYQDLLRHNASLISSGLRQ